MAVTQAGDVVTFSADNDVFPAADAVPRCNYLVKGVLLFNPTPGMTYTLKHYNTSGNVLWQRIVQDTAAPVPFDAVQFPTGGGLHLDTNDTGTAFGVHVYLG